MVLSERNTDIVRNGRRSRGPSPNGHASSATVLGGTGNTGAGAISVGSNSNSISVMGGASGTLLGSGGQGGGNGTPDTSSDDDNSIKRNGKSKKQSEYEEKIRVGRDYQAVCPPLVPEVERKPEVLNDRALLVWSPTKEIPDNKLEEYISVAKEKYGYNGEQALGMLFWHKHDLERAVLDLSNFTPFPDEWTVEDKVLFDQAFQFHGKSFHRIRQMLPDKSIASLVKYYYSWKKTRHRHSTMDKHEKAKASKEGSENGSENGSNEESDDDKIQNNKAEISALKKKNMEEGSDDTLRAAENLPRINARWTNEENMLAVQGVRKYGKDFQAIADLIGTKTEAHVRTFYCTHRRRYNLDQHVKKHEAEKEAALAASAAASSAVKSEDVEKLFARLSSSNSASSTEIVTTKKEDETIVLKKNGDEQEKIVKVNNESNKSSIILPANSNNTADITKNDSTENDTTEKEIIMEIDSDVEQSEPPPSKKIALAVSSQSHPEASAV